MVRQVRADTVQRLLDAQVADLSGDYPTAVRERTSAAGASAQAEYERRLAQDKAARRRPMVLSIAAAFAIVGILNISTNPIVGWACLGVSFIAVTSLISTLNHVTAWRTGADGEIRTARFLDALEGEGFVVLHDRRIPGARSANIDHIVIGPPGIFVVETKSFAGKLTIRGDEVYVGGHRKTAMLDEVRREALAVQVTLSDEIDAHGYRVTAMICVHRADLPWFRSEAGGVPIVSGKELVKRLRKGAMALSPADVQRLAATTDTRLQARVSRGDGIEARLVMRHASCRGGLASRGPHNDYSPAGLTIADGCGRAGSVRAPMTDHGQWCVRR